MTDLNKLIVLVDGSSYLFRAYYALPPLTNSQGEPTGAIYGVINMLKKLMTDYQTSKIAVIFDPKGKTFRHDLYPEYKANRVAMPSDLQQQIAPLHEIIRAMGLPLIVHEGVEADDVIGTLAKTAKEQGYQMVISTSDKDMAQLVNDKVTLVNTMTGKVMDRQGVEEKFGVAPARMIDYLALIGDTVDNIPGVPKVGPKTAVKWLKEYGDLDQIVQSAEAITGKVGENLRAHLGNLPCYRSLVTIKLDVNLSEKLSDIHLSAPDTQKLIALYSRFEFKNWLKDLQDNTQEVSDSTAGTYQTIFTEAALAQLLQRLDKAECFAFDTETTSLDAVQAELVGVSFAVDETAAYIPLAHDYPQAPAQLDRDKVLALIKPLLESNEKIIIGQNIKYDIEVLFKYGIQLNKNFMDTMVESYVMNGATTRHDMDTMAEKYLQHKTTHFEDVAGKGAKQKTFNEIEVDVASAYAAEDAAVTLRLHQWLYPKLQLDEKLQGVFEQLDMPLVSVLSRMELRGVLVDKAMLKAQSQALAERLDKLEAAAHKHAGKHFNLSSPKQLQEILFVDLGLPVFKKTPGGQPSTAENVLQELAFDFPLPKIILEHRSLSKLKSTYTDKLPLQINPLTNRVHTSYNQAVTATGRLSSNNPNLQNIPVRTEEGRKIRQAFIAQKGYKIISADYSQIELRIIADVSQDPGLLRAFNNNLDIHCSTAAEVFGVELGQVTDEQRRHAKSINFGLLYGMSAFGLSENLGIERHEAQHYMNRYFERYPKVRDYMDETEAFAKKHGYVETLFGRRIQISEINSKNVMRQKAAARAAINAPMQGSAADIIKKAMLCVDAWLQDSQFPAHMIMQVHDELILEVSEDRVDMAIQHLRTCMESAATLSVPLLVDVGVGLNWEQAH